MTDIEKLIAIEAIKVLKARYFRAVDSKDWALLKSVFTDDVDLDFRSAATVGDQNLLPATTQDILRGSEAAILLFDENLKGVETVHHGHMPEIEVVDANNARGVWAMFDLLTFPRGGPVSSLTGYGHYTEIYQRIDGVWKISSLKLTRLRLEAA